MHTFVLTRIVDATSDEILRFSQVQKHFAYMGEGLSIRCRPLTVCYDGEVLSYLYTIKVDALKFFRTENTSSQQFRVIIRLLDQLLGYGNFSVDDMTVSRVDYCYNIRIEDEDTRLILFDLLQKCPTRAIYTVRDVKYKTSIYSRSKSKTVNVYDKNTERSVKFFVSGNSKNLAKNFERDIVRMELQIKKGHLKYMAKQGVARSAKNWINAETERHYLQKMYGMFPKGDFYALDAAEHIVSYSNLTKTTKRHLIDFLREIAQNDMDTAKRKICYNTYRRYLNILADLGVNPITIPRDCGLSYIQSPFAFPEPQTDGLATIVRA